MRPSTPCASIRLTGPKTVLKILSMKTNKAPFVPRLPLEKLGPKRDDYSIIQKNILQGNWNSAAGALASAWEKKLLSAEQLKELSQILLNVSLHAKIPEAFLQYYGNFASSCEDFAQRIELLRIGVKLGCEICRNTLIQHLKEHIKGYSTDIPAVRQTRAEIYMLEGNIRGAQACWIKGHQAGDTEASYNLGVIEYQAQRYVEAKNYFRHAAKRAHPRALHALGLLYASNSNGLGQNLAYAKQLLFRAVQLGVPGAQNDYNKVSSRL